MDTPSSSPARILSSGFLLALLAPAAIVVGFGAWYYSLHAEQKAARKGTTQTFLRHALIAPTKLDAGLIDDTGDLVASAPKDPAKWIDPATLVFATLGQDQQREEERFADFAIHLAKATGKKVEIVAWTDTIPKQMEALRKGDVHLAALSTGAVSTGVNRGGLIPFCVMADAGGKFGYNMQIIVPAASPIKTPADLKGQRLSLASPYSHSGFKAPVVILWKEFGLQPVIDYETPIVGDQESVVVGVAKGELKAGAVASDMLKRMVAAKEIDPAAIRTIYTSVTFPPACFGYAHQLNRELAKKVQDAFLDFRWEGTSLEKAYAAAGQTKFERVSYKDAWAPVREIEEQAGRFVAAEQAKK